MRLIEKLKADIPMEWEAYTNHAFVHGMADGSLDKACFRHYLVQDYLFLIQFARAYALAVYKSPSLLLMRAGLDGLKAILDTELQLHIDLCGQWGLSPAEIEKRPESRATLAYTRYVLEAGQCGDLLDLYTALAPCVIGYGEIGKALSKSSSKSGSDNPYKIWIDEYSSQQYQQLAESARQMLDDLADTSLTPARYPRLLELFRQATRLEADFWQMGLDLAD